MVILNPPPGKCGAVQTVKLRPDLAHNSQFTIHYHSTLRRHAVWGTDCAIKQTTNKQIETQTDTYISFTHDACLLSKYGGIPTGNVGLVSPVKELQKYGNNARFDVISNKCNAHRTSISVTCSANKQKNNNKKATVTNNFFPRWNKKHIVKIYSWFPVTIFLFFHQTPLSIMRHPLCVDNNKVINNN
jgi:hypothetical protein